MEYSHLKTFLIQKMRMSHIYQPVMIRYLLTNGGVADDKMIAGEISQQDPSQIDYYRTITNNMVGRVLRNHGIVEKVNEQYVLKDYSTLSQIEIETLVNICNQKLSDYLDKRGNSVWEHRSKSRKIISGSIKYQVLKRAQFRCELCGVMDTERALEVDHIVPKNIGGEDSINNYQALCYRCNSMKRDTDVTDFRGVNEKYLHREQHCPFCTIDKKRIVKENNLAFIIFDKFPVVQYHALIIPKRHFSEYFEIAQPELNSVQALLQTGKELVLAKDNTVEGFNIGVNSGQVAGQTVFHCHIHLIPRRKLDVENPEGGVRHIIPNKGNYLV